MVQFKSLEKRLSKDPFLYKRYAETIQDDLDKSYVIKVESRDDKHCAGREWYLPHHPVVKPNKPEKVRRVLNGASKFQGISLNSVLLTGPELLQSLVHTLMRFRRHHFAVSADIEGKFLQVGVLPAEQGGFKLTRFISNVPGLLEELEYKSVEQVPKEIGASREESSSHVLGLKWDHVNDTLVVSRRTICDASTAVTQRLVLSLVSKIFDPIGLVSLFTVKTRLLLKDVWRLHGQRWDDVLPKEMIERFESWSSELPKLGLMKISRSYFPGSFEHLKLNVFGYSSQELFSPVAFLRALVNSSDNEKTTELAFVIGKARVVPMKVLTVPKLELQAALLASRLREEICEALTIQIQRTFMWTDSTTVLQWLNSLEKQPIFVANCVSEILEGTTVDKWHHVATQNNPVDTGTRGLSSEALQNSAWLRGPDFLRTSDFPFRPGTEMVSNIKLKRQAADPNPLDNCSTLQSNSLNSDFSIHLHKYSSYPKILRIVAKRSSKPVQPMMADLPSERLAFQCPPFTNVGLDYFGPFHVTIRRSSEKRWGFLLTCLTTRAVHVEIAHSMDTNSCVMGIERFIARRGMPLVFCSDNGTNFVGTEKELLLCFLNLAKKKIASELAQKGVKWKFNPPAAPHHGGVWESKVSKVYDARAKIEKELCKLYESIDDAIHEKARRVRVESLVTKCKDLLENYSTQDNENSKKSSQRSHKSLSAGTSPKASSTHRKDFLLAKIRREEVEEENKAAARIAEREYEIEMAEKEREMAERRHEI
ncbi:uncharacterized protein LOC142350403 [Convolutriloba macropyga]|uniref:uncharacterized protein LOC142350403 n=1 Tax=Convolutriloba macropyga TaxID=536237 RepID=UPI003F523033